MDQCEKGWSWGIETLGGGAASSDVLRFAVKAPRDSCIRRRDEGEKKRRRGSGGRGVKTESKGK